MVQEFNDALKEQNTYSGEGAFCFKMGARWARNWLQENNMLKYKKSKKKLTFAPPRRSLKLIISESAFRARTRQRLKEALMFGPMNEIEQRIENAIDYVHKEFHATIGAAFTIGVLISHPIYDFVKYLIVSIL